MNKEEIQYLTNEKLDEGLDFPEINEEIKTLKQSQIIFKNQKKEIEIAKKVIERQDNLIKEQKNKIFKLRLQIDMDNDSKREELKENNNCELRNIKRVLLIFKELNKPLNLSDIEKNCFLKREKVLSCLGILEYFNKIKMEKDKDRVQKWRLI
jgi:hypothetical protein